jgi:hypothetical protein
VTPVQQLQEQCRLFNATMSDRQSEVRKDRRRAIAGVVILSGLLITTMTFGFLFGG